MGNEMTDWAANVLRRVVFRQDGGLTIVGKIIGIVTLLFLFAACSALSGCVNCYTRWPTTDKRIYRVYQSSREAAALSVLASFPQAMSDGPSRGFVWENLLTITFLGLPCAADAVCEACIDSACLPVDWPLAASRKRKREAWQQENAAGISEFEEVSPKRNGVWKYKAPDGVNEITRYPDGTESVTLAYVVTPPQPLPKDTVFVTSECASVTNKTVEPANWNCSHQNFVQEEK